MYTSSLDITANRRTLLAGVALLACGSTLVPTMVSAEGGLKGSSGDPEPDDALAELGLTGERSYESPQFGYQLDWARDWAVDEAGPGESDRAEELDILVLRWASDEIAYINFMGFTMLAPNIELMMDNAENPEMVAELYGGDYGVEIVLSERDDDIQEVAYHLVAGDDPDTQRWMISSLRVLDEGLVLTTNVLLVDEDLLVEVSEAFVDGVSLNGEPLMQLLSADAILEAYAAGR